MWQEEEPRDTDDKVSFHYLLDEDPRRRPRARIDIFEHVSQIFARSLVTETPRTEEEEQQGDAWRIMYYTLRSLEKLG